MSDPPVGASIYYSFPFHYAILRYQSGTGPDDFAAPGPPLHWFGAEREDEWPVVWLSDHMLLRARLRNQKFELLILLIRFFGW
jgi:hypothetical protein